MAMTNPGSTYIWPIFVVLSAQFVPQVLASCTDGSVCSYSQYCCSSGGCCDESYQQPYYWSIWNMWYFWFIIIFILMSCFGGCGYWKRRQWMLAQHRAAAQHTTVAGIPQCHVPPPGFIPPPGQAYPTQGYPTQQYPYTYDNACPPAPTPQGAFPAPPAYNEVVSKPGQYPDNKLPPYPGVGAGGDPEAEKPDEAAAVAPPSYMPMPVPAVSTAPPATAVSTAPPAPQ